MNDAGVKNQCENIICVALCDSRVNTCSSRRVVGQSRPLSSHSSLRHSVVIAKAAVYKQDFPLTHPNFISLSTLKSTIPSTTTPEAS